MKREPKPPKRDLTGNTYGLLTVIQMAQTDKSKRGTWRAICDCQCGTKNKDIGVWALLRGRTKSCGCDKSRYEKTRGKRSSLYTGYEGISGKLWGTIKRRASKKGRKIEVDIEYAWNLYKSQNGKCALSGLSICFGVSNHLNSETTASLDRIDNSLGYVEGNVQWVHKDVNMMKNILDNSVFVNLCRKISSHRTDITELSDLELSRNHRV